MSRHASAPWLFNPFWCACLREGERGGGKCVCVRVSVCQDMPWRHGRSILSGVRMSVSMSLSVCVSQRGGKRDRVCVEVWVRVGVLFIPPVPHGQARARTHTRTHTHTQERYQEDLRSRDERKLKLVEKVRQQDPNCRECTFSPNIISSKSAH